MESVTENRPIPYYTFKTSDREVKKLLEAMRAVDLEPLGPERLRQWQVETEAAYPQAVWRDCNVGLEWIRDQHFDLHMPARAAFYVGMIVSKIVGTWIAPTSHHVHFCIYELSDNDGVVYATLLTFQLGHSTNWLAPRYEVPVTMWRKPIDTADFAEVVPNAYGK